MRKDHYILWKDGNICKDENSKIMKGILTNSEVNVYVKSNIDEAIDLIRKKKHAAVKLIAKAGSDLSCRDLILRSREIIGSNFVCLVFSPTEDRIEWIPEMENVLFTRDSEDLKKFALLRMNINDLLAFVEELRSKYERDGFHFNINEKELLSYPNCHNRDPYYMEYYKNYNPNNDNNNNES